MGNATSLFNLMRNLGGSMGIATVTTMYERFTQKFVNRLGENVTPFDPGATAMLESLRSLWTGAGSGPALADRQAIAGMYGLVQRQAAMLAFVEAFVLLAVVFLLMIPLILITKRPPRGARAQMGH
jgi:DHA2 family multidrug resistance protein